MARFVFTLGPVLRQRVREEEAAQRVVAERERVRLDAEREVMAIQSRMEGERREWRGRLGVEGAVDVREVRMQAGVAIRDMAAMRRAVLSLAAAEKHVREARTALLEAARRRQAIEELRERRWLEWKAERARVEQRALDDLVVMGHGRGTGEGDSEGDR
jgi:flagellar export protein FliJ